MQTRTAKRRPRRIEAAAVLALACTTSAGLVQAQPAAAAATVSSPVASVAWQKGKTYTIIWTRGTPGRRPLKLMRGQATALQQIAEIAVVDGAPGRYDWAVPADLPSDSTCAIALGSAPDIGCSGQFTITTGPTGPVPGPPAPPVPIKRP